MENAQIFEMADRLKAAKELKKDLDAQVKAVNAEIEQLDRDLSDAMAEQELDKLEKSYKDKDDGTKELEIEDLEIFENVAYIMALHADPSTPASIDEWLDQFEMFSIYEVLPEILELWGSNLFTDAKSAKN